MGRQTRSRADYQDYQCGLGGLVNLSITRGLLIDPGSATLSNV